MKKKTILLARAAMTLLLAVLGSAGVGAQSEVVSIGSTDRSDSYLPIDQYSKYSLTQQIYTKDEINHAAGKITSIAFYGWEYGQARTCDIYLTATTKNDFESNTDWVTVAPDDKVFSGQVTVNMNQWTVIDFDTPFEYDGNTNLLVTVDDNSNVANSSTVYWGVFSASGNQALYYSKRYSTPVNLDPTQSIEESGAYYGKKNSLQLCFETYIKPYRVEAVEVGDKSALVQCSLRGDATAWNLRYREVAAEGEQEQRWVAYNNLTDRSYTMEELKPATKYEVQVQAVFADNNLSDWTTPMVFTTNCCPVEEQVELIYALRSRNYVGWFGFAVQIMDITDAENPVEAAYLSAPSHELYGGSVTLCCGHKYQVNWIYDADYAVYNDGKSFALYLEPGDLIYSMAYGEAPAETAELTTFVADCGSYCTQMPQIVNEAGTTYDSATLTFVSQTKKGQVVYSTEPDFDPETATPQDVDFEELPQSDDPWGGTQPNASVTLKGLQPLTTYYVSVRSVCTAEPIGRSRWTKPVKITTGSRYDGPSQPIAKPISSSSEGLSWGSRGNEKKFNLYYRQQAAGNAVDATAVETFGGGKGTGFENGSWGEGIWSSYGDRPFSNTLFVTNVPAGSSFGFKAGNGKTGAGKTQFVYGLVKQEAGKTAKETMVKFDRECLNDADREAIIKELQNKVKELTDEQQIAAYNAEIEELKSLPTDAEKLARMKELENALATGGLSQEERQSKQAELSKLRVQTSSAENPQKDGFAITNNGQSGANARGFRAPEDETYIFFVRHADPNGVLLVKDLTITPADQVGEWTCIPNIKGTEYTLTGLEPSTTYEVMVEPVYDDGTTGTQSPITVFTTLGEETEPVKGEFSVAEGKKVQFAHGNLRCKGTEYEDEWSMAKQQYEVLGQDNIEVSGTRSYPAWLVDLLCWSTTKNYYGIDNYYSYNDEKALPYFQGDFTDWGECPALVRDLGPGWSTLTKDEWNYLLNGRENAAQLQMTATVAGVKGLVLLPDAWEAPDGLLISEEMTAEQWATVEQTGVVFLPAAGQLTSTYVDYAANTTVNDACTYWTATPSDNDSEVTSYVLTIGDAGATLEAALNRRVMTAVRLVKAVPAVATGDVDGDGDTDGDDIQTVLDYLLGKTTAVPANADMDGNGVVDIVDLTRMIEKAK